MRGIYAGGKFKFPLYRFTQKKWANCFFNTGQLRLGTLFDYALNEKYGDAIHDRHEGYYVWKPPKGERENNPKAHFVIARNNLLLCSSTEYDKAYYDEFNANCCIQINSLEFFIAIDEAIKKDFTPFLLRKVIYYNKSRWDSIPNREDFAGLMKDISFSSQKEVRALWEPKKYPYENKEFEFDSEKFNNLENPLIEYPEGEEYTKRIKKESKRLKPRTIFIPEARKYCTLKNKK